MSEEVYVIESKQKFLGPALNNGNLGWDTRSALIFFEKPLAELYAKQNRGDVVTLNSDNGEKLVKVNSQEDEILKNTKASASGCPLQYLAAETKGWNPDRQYKLIKALANGYVKENQYFVYKVLPGDTAGMTIVQAIKEDEHINHVMYVGSTVRSDFCADALFTNREINEYGLEDLNKQPVED